VRSSPYSRFNPQFDREPLTAALAAQNVAYPFLGNMLGGKPRGTDYLPEDGARFSLIAETEQFRTALARLQEEVWCRRTAIMCAEKDPMHCHRGLLICPNMPAGVAIHHILADGSIREHAELDLPEWKDDTDEQCLF